MLNWNQTRESRGLLFSLLCCVALLLAGCGGGGGDDDPIGGDFGQVSGDTDPLPTSVNQAAYQGGSTYAYGHNSIPSIPFTNAPADTDYDRWAMLHDGATYRLYFMKQGTTTLYQFGFNGSAYDFGHDSIPEIEVGGMPADADTSSFKMLHDGRDYRLYMRSLSDPRNVYQAAFNPSTSQYEYGFRSIDVIATTGLPADADLSRWAMLFDGSVYRQYVARIGSETVLYQCGFDGASYAFGHRSISTLDVIGMPENSETASFSMLHDGADYRFYHLAD